MKCIFTIMKKITNEVVGDAKVQNAEDIGIRKDNWLEGSNIPYTEVLMFIFLG